MELLYAAGGGDTGAFNELVLRYGPVMQRAALAVLRDVSDAEDAAQDGWVALWRSCPAIARERRVDGSAIGIIVHTGRLAAFAILRKRAAKKRGEGHPERHEKEVRRALHNLHQYRRHGVNYEMCERTPETDPLEKMGMVHRLVFQLPPDCAAKLDGYFFQGKSLTELAVERACGIPEVQRGLNDAIQIIRHLARKEPEMSEAA